MSTRGEYCPVRKCNQLMRKDEVQLHLVNCHHWCISCKEAFTSQSSLEDHYRGKPSHPNCPRCKKGFLNQALVDEHFAATHAKNRCSCGVELFVEDNAEHYRHSPMHPACPSCPVGFKVDEEFMEHCRDTHPDRHCALCKRQFFSQPEMDNHYRDSIMHPSCEKCGAGFFGDEDLNKHLGEIHGRWEYVPSVPLPAPSKKGIPQLWGETENINRFPPAFHSFQYTQDQDRSTSSIYASPSTTPVSSSPAFSGVTSHGYNSLGNDSTRHQSSPWSNVGTSTYARAARTSSVLSASTGDHTSSTSLSSAYNISPLLSRELPKSGSARSSSDAFDCPSCATALVVRVVPRGGR